MSPAGGVRLSAYLIVKNESRDLPACLDSLRGLADELVVVDDESTDDTAALCRERGARVFTRALDGFGTQKQYALDRCGGEWVLSIDADERVTAELAAEIRSVIGRAGGPDGYLLSRKMYFLGHRLRFGGVGKDWVLRLFRRGRGKYLPLEIHEKVEVDGTVSRLQGSLEHYSYATLEEYLEKIPSYTALAARQRFAAGARFTVLHHARPGWELFSRVVLKGAWLDGQPGLIYAALSSHAAWLRAVKLWELEHSQRG